MVAPDHELLADELERILDGLWGRRLVLGATPRLHALPFALRAALFTMVGVSATALVGRLLHEPLLLRQIDVWAGLLLLVTLIAYEWLANHVKRLARTQIIPELSPQVVAHARAWAATHPLLTRQAILCGLVGLLTAAPLLLALRMFASHHGAATLVLVAVGSAMVTSCIYIPASVSVLSLLVADSRVPLFPLDPGRTRLVGALRQLGQRTVVVSAAMATVGALGPPLLPGAGPVAYLLSGLVLLGAVLASGAQYLVQQYALGSLLARTRIEAMAALQGEIAPLFARRCELASDERAKLQQLLALYDRVVAASIQVFTLRDALRYVSPFLIPLLTMALSALHIQIPERSMVWVVLRQFLKS